MNQLVPSVVTVTDPEFDVIFTCEAPSIDCNTLLTVEPEMTRLLVAADPLISLKTYVFPAPTVAAFGNVPVII